MISVLAQERLLGATLGSMFIGGIVFKQHRDIYRTISDHHKQPLLISHHQRDSLFGNNSISSNVVNAWNKTVDATLGNLVAYLGSRKW